MSLLERPFDIQQKTAAVAARLGSARLGNARLGNARLGNARLGNVRLAQACAAHRIRVGLTGLAAIFLLVLVAAAGLRPSPSVAAVDPQAEPLAVLGVAPGAGPAAMGHDDPPAAAPDRPSRT